MLSRTFHSLTKGKFLLLVKGQGGRCWCPKKPTCPRSLWWGFLLHLKDCLLLYLSGRESRLDITQFEYDRFSKSDFLLLKFLQSRKGLNKCYLWERLSGPIFCRVSKGLYSPVDSLCKQSWILWLDLGRMRWEELDWNLLRWSHTFICIFIKIFHQL